mmetsp:Transcript_36080/g.55406  ORF Transcript_36080/g.55406 Transcript_36080/m.55406 type:complete len:118 (+) Transcript_36080:3187-3540(+)
MKQTADYIKCKISELNIVTKQGFLPTNVLSDQIKNYEVNEIAIRRTAPDQLEKISPSYVFGYNRDFLELLLDVIRNGRESTSNEGILLIERLQNSPLFEKDLYDRIMKLKPLQQKNT